MDIIYEILKTWKEECGYDGVIQFRYSHLKGKLSIFTVHPGYLIGKAGYYSKKYSEILKNKLPGFNGIDFIDTDHHVIK